MADKDTLRDFHTRNRRLDQGPMMPGAHAYSTTSESKALFERLFDCPKDDIAFYVQLKPL